MDLTSITINAAVEIFLLMLIGIGPKLALLPFLQVTASLDAEAKSRVQRKMLSTAATAAVALVILGELLRTILHFSVASLSAAGGIILLVLAVPMVLGQSDTGAISFEGRDPMKLAQVPLAVPYLLNPVGIVALVTVSAEADSVGVLVVALACLGLVLLLDLVVFRWANQVSARLDEDRLLVAEKVFGFLIAAIAIQLVFDGLASAGIIAPVLH